MFKIIISNKIANKILIIGYQRNITFLYYKYNFIVVVFNNSRTHFSSFLVQVEEKIII